MFLMPLLTVTDAMLTASNVPEDDKPAWAPGTTYAKGAQVIADAPSGPVNGFTWPVPRLIYESAAAGSVGKPPRENLFDAEVSSDTAGKWIIVKAPQRWQPFDWRTTDRVISAGAITYTLTLPSLVTGVAFFNLNGISVTVAARDLTDAVVWSETKDLTNTSAITDWFEYFNWQPDLLSDVAFAGVPGYPGWKLDITISGFNSRVGQIALGRWVQLGVTQPDTEVGFEDRSTKERDAQGNVTLVARDYTDIVSFRFHMPVGDERRVKREVAKQAGIPAVWSAGENHSHRGTTVFGFNSGSLRIPLQVAGRSFASIEIEDLT